MQRSVYRLGASISPMSARTAAVEADLVALKRAAERAGTALACLFSSADEFEADIIRERRPAGRYAPLRRRRRLKHAALAVALASALLLI
jgi:hypothetical protein